MRPQTLLRLGVMNLRVLRPIERVYLLARFPSVARLALRLFRDRRVSPLSKITTFGVIGLALSPLNVPAWIPVLGQAGDLLVVVNILDLFISAAPRHVVQEHISALGLEGKFRV